MVETKNVAAGQFDATALNVLKEAKNVAEIASLIETVVKGLEAWAARLGIDGLDKTQGDESVSEVSGVVSRGNSRSSDLKTQTRHERDDPFIEMKQELETLRKEMLSHASVALSAENIRTEIATMNIKINNLMERFETASQLAISDDPRRHGYSAAVTPY